MTILSRRHVWVITLFKAAKLAAAIVAAAILAVGGQILTVSPASAQGEGTTTQEAATLTKRPFRLPFAQPPGLNTWLMAQPYGNTTGAYRQRFTTYGASGGIHFGLDLSAPCGTEVVAIADGIVFAVDGPFGSPPHNLMIDHPQFGYASMYGHLLQPAALSPGQQVKQGEVIAFTGDIAETCYGRPHLHLEIRDLNHVRKFNPVLLIEANWDNLALTGNVGRDFARDLNEPRKWQSLYDQPEARTGGPIVNDFANPWPFDWSLQTTNPATLVSLGLSHFLGGSVWIATNASVRIQALLAGYGYPARAISPKFWAIPVSRVEVSPAPAPLSPPALASIPGVGRQITASDCCTQPYWSQDSTQVHFIDRPGPNGPLGIWGVDLTQLEAGTQLITERLGIYSPDGALVAYPDRNRGITVIERLADGQKWEIDTQEQSVNFSPDGLHLIWTVSNEANGGPLPPRDNREEAIWIANVDGANARIVFQGQRISRIGWLSDDQWLMSRRISGSSDIQLFTLSLADGSQQEVYQQLPAIRGLAFSPDRRYLVYYVAFEADHNKNGLWLLDFQNPAQGPQKLPFFGAYRWRDQQRLIYIPLEPEATEHNFYEYDTLTGQTRPLFPEGTNLMIANNDWRVSPDGRHIVLVAANQDTLNGIWVLDLD
jgi:hypothetical protein